MHDKLNEGGQEQNSQLTMLFPAACLPFGEASRISRNINGASREGLRSHALSLPCYASSGVFPFDRRERPLCMDLRELPS